MIYSLSRTLEILPWLGWAAIACVLAVLEVRHSRARGPVPVGPEREGGGFLPPPGDGYMYFASARHTCYLLRQSRSLYRVYLLRGAPPDIHLSRDRYGSYFTVQARDPAAAEQAVDGLLGL